MSQVEVHHTWEAKQWDWPLQQNDGVVKVINTKEKFEVGLDVVFFTPKEIDVKVNGHNIIVHAAHQARSDNHGKVSREVTRSYALPEDVDTATIKSHLSKRGVLTITASKKQ
uniref:SHSP domain-containing protein n=1 Tax=Panagrellus redivivus TaxID=6233 RepID=A0A7E4VS00_PANRE